MLYKQLQQIRQQLSRHQIKLSDALLIVFRYLRQTVPAERLIWLNRELLGYRSDDLNALYEPPRNRKIAFLPSARRKNELEIPAYRFLSGHWGSLDGDGSVKSITEQHLADKSIFCNIGIQQLETQLDELGDSDLSLFSMSVDEETGAEFYCSSSELVRIHAAVHTKLCRFIDSLIEELKVAAKES